MTDPAKPSPESGTEKRQQWEYCSADCDNVKLNALGLEGWEAVNVITELRRNSYGAEWQEHWVLLKRIKP